MHGEGLTQTVTITVMQSWKVGERGATKSSRWVGGVQQSLQGGGWGGGNKVFKGGRSGVASSLKFYRL